MLFHDADDHDDDEKEEEYCIIFGHQDRHRGLAGEHEESPRPTAGKSDRQNVYRLTFNWESSMYSDTSLLDRMISGRDC